MMSSRGLILLALVGTACALPSPGPIKAVTLAQKGLNSRTAPPLPRSSASVAPLRGGALPLVSATNFQKVEAVWSLICGLSLFLDYKFACKYVFFMNKEPAIADLPREILATTFMAWAVSSYFAVTQGELAAKFFSRLNFWSTGLMTAVLLCPRHKVPAATIACSALCTLANGYFGFA